MYRLGPEECRNPLGRQALTCRLRNPPWLLLGLNDTQFGVGGYDPSGLMAAATLDIEFELPLMRSSGGFRRKTMIRITKKAVDILEINNGLLCQRRLKKRRPGGFKQAHEEQRGCRYDQLSHSQLAKHGCMLLAGCVLLVHEMGSTF